MSEICLLNDSFPPAIDGVANTVVNYARILGSRGREVCVVTPDFPDAHDQDFPFPVVRYPSVDIRKWLGYTAGNPFSMGTLRKLKQHDFSLLHSHCPVMSQVVARTLRESMDIPVVLTYHTKFDIDITGALGSKIMQDSVISMLVDSVSSADELWVVSRGAGESIRSLGYEGDYVVMENGVDLPRARATEAQIAEATAGADLPEGLPVFLFVGRMMWYKGIRIILDALAALASRGVDFRMVFVGGGLEADEIMAYAKARGLGEKCLFKGPIHDRDTLVAWYSRANLLLFPSTYDTNGLVVREAAACSLGAVLVRDSCAAEGVADNVNGLLIDENAASLAVCLAQVLDHPDTMRRLGEAASRDLYVSWEDAVAKAEERYQVVLDNHRSGVYEKKRRLSDSLFSLSGNFLDFYDKALGLWNRDERSVRYR